MRQNEQLQRLVPADRSPSAVKRTAHEEGDEAAVLFEQMEGGARPPQPGPQRNGPNAPAPKRYEAKPYKPKKQHRG